MYAAPDFKDGTRIAKVFNLLSDGNRHPTEEVRAVGGPEGTRRVREIRELGYAVNVERDDDGKVFYRMPITVAR